MITDRAGREYLSDGFSETATWSLSRPASPHPQNPPPATPNQARSGGATDPNALWNWADQAGKIGYEAAHKLNSIKPISVFSDEPPLGGHAGGTLHLTVETDCVERDYTLDCHAKGARGPRIALQDESGREAPPKAAAYGLSGLAFGGSARPADGGYSSLAQQAEADFLTALRMGYPERRDWDASGRPGGRAFDAMTLPDGRALPPLTADDVVGVIGRHGLGLSDAPRALLEGLEPEGVVEIVRAAVEQDERLRTAMVDESRRRPITLDNLPDLPRAARNGVAEAMLSPTRGPSEELELLGRLTGRPAGRPEPETVMGEIENRLNALPSEWREPFRDEIAMKRARDVENDMLVAEISAERGAPTDSEFQPNSLHPAPPSVDFLVDALAKAAPPPPLHPDQLVSLGLTADAQREAREAAAAALNRYVDEAPQAADFLKQLGTELRISEKTGGAGRLPRLTDSPDERSGEEGRRKAADTLLDWSDEVGLLDKAGGLEGALIGLRSDPKPPLGAKPEVVLAVAVAEELGEALREASRRHPDPGERAEYRRSMVRAVGGMISDARDRILAREQDPERSRSVGDR